MRRDRQQIYIDVLKAIKGGNSCPTRINRAANLSYTPLCDNILPYLLKVGLIVESAANDASDKRLRRLYALTAQGEVAVNAYSKGKDGVLR